MLKKKLLCCESDQALEELSREVVEPPSAEISKTQLDTVLSNLLQQTVGRDGLQRPRPTSATLRFCDLKHPCFYLHKPGLPFLVQIHVSHWISAQHLLTAMETVQVALQVTVQWLGRRLSPKVPSSLLFQPPFGMLINTALTFS